MIICLWSLQEQVDDLIWSLASLSVSFLTTFTVTISSPPSLSVTVSLLTPTCNAPWSSCSTSCSLVTHLHWLLSSPHQLHLIIAQYWTILLLSSIPSMIESHIFIQASSTTTIKQPCWTPELDYHNWEIDRCERLQKMLLIKGWICCHIINKTCP